MNIPEFLKQILIEEYGEELYNSILEGYSENRPTTFRVNTLKSNIEEVKEILEKYRIRYSFIQWYKDAFILEEDYPIQDLDIYKDGKIYLQSLSSMIPAIVLNPKEKENILDMCSAPGRKNNTNFSFIRKQSNDYCMREK